MARYLGVDPSTRKLALVALREEGSVEWTSELVASGRRPADRLEELATRFAELLRALDYGPWVYVEDVSYVRNRGTVVGLAQVLGAVRLVCAQEGVPCTVISGQEWKGRLGIGANAKKAAIRAWAEAAGQPTGWSQDLVDAYGIAEAGRRGGV